MSENTDDKKPVEVVFAPGCFDHFEGTQEELDELVNQITEMAKSGELFTKSNPVDIESLMDELSDEEIEDLIDQIAEMEETDGKVTSKRTLQ